MKKYISLWKNLPASAKSSILFVFSTFILKGVSFITTPIFTRIMPQSEYGLITNYNSWLSIIEVFAVLGLTSAGVINVGLNDYRNSRERYLSALLGLSNASTVITFVIIIFLKLFLGDVFLLSESLLVIMFVHFIFHPAQVFWLAKQRYEFKYTASTIISIGSVLLGQVLAVYFVTTADSDWGSVKIWTSEIGTLLFAIPIYLLLLIKGGAFIDIPLWKSVLAFSLPLIPHYLAQHLMSGADKIMITRLVGAADAAIYGVVANIGMIATILWSAVNASLVPITFDSINRNEFVKLRKTINIILSGYGTACVGVILIAPEVLRFLAPEEYSGGLYVIPPLVAVSFLNALYNVFANVEFYYKKTSHIAKATIVATVVNLVLNFSLIPRYSYTGAAYATLISNAILILMHYLGYRKCNNKIYNNRFIIILSVGMVVFTAICNVFYKLHTLRLLLIVAILFALVTNYKKILKIIQGILKK